MGTNEITFVLFHNIFDLIKYDKTYFKITKTHCIIWVYKNEVSIVYNIQFLVFIYHDIRYYINSIEA